jgi:iron complex outermembrane receptor protein
MHLSATGKSRVLYRNLPVAAVLVMGLGQPTGAHAETPAKTANAPIAAEPTDGADAAAAGEIVVTARRRTEKAQDVPIAMDVIGGAALESKAAFHLQQFYQEVPSLTVYTFNPRNVTINIRGLGSNIAFTNNGLDNGVGFYIDDVYYSRVGQAGFDLVDIDHLEVLRGPQGTLFGRNTTAGAISVTTKKPSFTPEGSADVSVGNYNFFQARGSISGPITDKLAARLSVETTTRGGYLYDTYQKRGVHDFDNVTLRGQLLYQPSDRLSIRLIGDYARQRTTCCVSTILGYATTYDNGAAIARPYLDRAAELGYTPPPIDPQARRTDSDWLGPIRINQGGVSARIDWDLGASTLTSISAFRFWNWSPRNDSDSSALNIDLEGNAYDRQKQWSQEIRLASNGTHAIDYVVGLYYFRQRLPSHTLIEYGRDAGIYNIAPGTSGLTADQRSAALFGAYGDFISMARTDSYAAFGQATWHITHGLSLTGGLRYTYEQKSGNYEQVRGSRVDISGLNAAQIALRNSFTPLVPYYELRKNWGSLSGLATLSQQITPDVLIYATYSRGAKSGGLNFANLPRDANGNPLLELAIVKPEKVDSFEIGLKSQWFNHRLTANLAVFLTRVRDYQSNIIDQSVTPARLYIANVGKVESKGIELDLRATPVGGLSLYASGTFNPAKYASYTNAQCPFELRAPGQPTVCDLSGQQLPAAPRYAASAGGEVTVPISRDVKAFAGADYSYRSSYFSTYNNSRYSLVDGAGLVNARIGVKQADGKWEASLWGRNLFNNLTYYSKSIQDIGGRLIGSLGDPRTVGATVRHRF